MVWGGEGWVGRRTICQEGCLVASALMGRAGEEDSVLVVAAVVGGRRIFAVGLLECCCCCVTRRVFEAVAGGEAVHWLLWWACRRVCMMGLGGWIERVLEGVEGRKRRSLCSRRGWLGLRMPWVWF